MAPVAAEIIPGRPPANAIIVAILNEAYNPTIGSTPAIIEKAIASGINASATTIPASTSPLIFENHSFFKLSTTLSNSFYDVQKNYSVLFLKTQQKSSYHFKNGIQTNMHDIGVVYLVWSQVR